LAIFTKRIFQVADIRIFKNLMKTPSVAKNEMAARTRVNVVTTGNSVVVLVLNPAGGCSSYSCPKK
jgi:hypothetical protein